MKSVFFSTMGGVPNKMLYNVYMKTLKLRCNNFLEFSSIFSQLFHPLFQLLQRVDQSFYNSSDPSTGTKVRLHATPREGKPYFRVQNKGGGYLEDNGVFPNNASRQELRELTHFYFIHHLIKKENERLCVPLQVSLETMLELRLPSFSFPL